VSIRRSLVSATVCIMVPAGYVFGADHGWWGDQPTRCQAPGAQTTATAPLRVTTAASVGMTTGSWLRKLDSPPPSKAEMYAVADRAAEGVTAYVLAFKAAARKQRQSEYVEKYQQRMYANKLKHLPTNASTCSPCPTAQPNGQPLTVANRGGLTAEQRQNAATIAAAGAARGVPVQGQVIALAAALQESGLRNLDHGDRDSVGVFQQRAAGYGSVADRMNVTVAAGRFYDILERVPGWQSMTVTAAAQAVQRSAYPGAYAQWEGQARSLVGGVQTVGADSYTCTLAPSTYKTGAGVAWGGYQNGRVPLTALAHPAQAPTAWFRPDAAAAFDRLSAAYAARFGHPLRVTDSYRDYAHQVSTKAAKPGLAAEPGTSNHGWGLAADIIVGSYSSADYLWLRANGPRYGWDNPTWARQGGSRPEKWHWDFTPPGAAA
jgi:hypothetical protein